MVFPSFRIELSGTVHPLYHPAKKREGSINEIVRKKRKENLEKNWLLKILSRKDLDLRCQIKFTV